MRVVVLIDDLDRADPKILPALLFALREVVDTAGYSFVLALDPDVVGKALADYHLGFGDGKEFLEKFIEFPRWLPEPSDDSLRALMLACVRDSACAFVDVPP